MELRACVINGKKALFHRWIDKEELLVKPEQAIRSDRLHNLQFMMENNIIPAGYSIEKVTNTFGLVEFEDGLVQIIKPEEIRFVDSHNIHVL